MTRTHENVNPVTTTHSKHQWYKGQFISITYLLKSLIWEEALGLFIGQTAVFCIPQPQLRSAPGPACTETPGKRVTLCGSEMWNSFPRQPTAPLSVYAASSCGTQLYWWLSLIAGKLTQAAWPENKEKSFTAAFLSISLLKHSLNSKSK